MLLGLISWSTGLLIYNVRHSLQFWMPDDRWTDYDLQRPSFTDGLWPWMRGIGEGWATVAAFIVIGSVVGWALLWLARRVNQRKEFLLAILASSFPIVMGVTTTWGGWLFLPTASLFTAAAATVSFDIYRSKSARFIELAIAVTPLLLLLLIP